MCADGLDYDFIEEAGYDELQQAIHGRVKIPDSCMKEWRGLKFPFTPWVWYAFLTGEEPTDAFKKTGFHKWENSFVERVRNLRRRLFPWGRLAGLAKSIGFSPRYKQFDGESLLDLEGAKSANMMLTKKTVFLPFLIDEMSRFSFD